MLSWLKKRWKTILLFHKYYRRTGLYKFLFRNIIKVTAIIIFLLLLFLIIERYIIDFDDVFKEFIGNLRWYVVLIVFFISETFFGLIPPDLFIIWAHSFPHEFLVITYLACLSYIGGLLAFKIGNSIRKIPAINLFVNKRFQAHFGTFKKWGGILIILSAYFPLPFSTVSLVAGVMQYPLKFYLIFALSRIPRFYIFSLFLFQFIK